MSRRADECSLKLAFITDFDVYYNSILMTRKIFAPIINRVNRSDQ